MNKKILEKRGITEVVFDEKTKLWNIYSINDLSKPGTGSNKYFGRGAKLPIYRNANGYWSVYVWNTKLHAPTNIALHRLIYMWFKSPGGLDPSIKIYFKDGDKNNLSLDNLIAK